jgi:surfeit locus 1 family protein
MRFRPRAVPTALTLAMLAILIGLGTWQLHRRVWKENLLASIATGLHAPPVTLPAELADPPAWTFRRVHVTGRFDPAHAFWLYGRTYQGAAGIHLLAPLIREAGDAVLVDRGFVPFEHGGGLAPYAMESGPVEIDGIVRMPESGGWFVPANDPRQNIWYSVDIPAMSRLAGMTLTPVYVAQLSGQNAAWPAGTGGTEALGIRNEHLNYAIFWYGMAAALSVIYVLSSTRRRPE